MATRKRISKILTQDWPPTDHPTRIKALQEIAGRLPFHERYLAGEFRNVWAELAALGDAVWYDPIAIDALAVAYETMHRAKTNIETLVSRLGAVGYDFQPTAYSAYWKTSRADAAMADMFEEFLNEASVERPMILPGALEGQREQLLARRQQQRAGMQAQATVARERRMGIVRPLMAGDHVAAILIKRVVRSAGEIPLSLRAWHATIGGVNLVGSHPELAPPGVECDPLFVAPCRFVLDLCLAWAEEHVDEDDPRPFRMPVSPHRSAKAGGDASAPLYVVTLPNTGLDAVIENEGHGLYFVDYLRMAFEWGGFPGYADMPAQAPKLIAWLAEGLLPL